MSDVGVLIVGGGLAGCTVAKALDDGVVRADQMFNTESYSIGTARIKDSHSHPQLAVWEIIQKSSNVGALKIAQRWLDTLQ